MEKRQVKSNAFLSAFFGPALATTGYLKPERLSLRDQRRLEWSWIFYDCGNSAFSMSVNTALFPVFLALFLTNTSDSLNIGYYSSLSSIFVAILSPILGTIADYRDKKKRFFTFFFLLGFFMTLAFAFVPASTWYLLLPIYVLANVGYAASNIFYDAFLVDAVKPSRLDLVSSEGFAYGYIFSVIPFVICLPFIYFIGTHTPLGYRIAFVITALWWGLFTIPMLRNVRQCYCIENEEKFVKKSFQRLFQTFKEIRQYKTVFIFLLGYFFYIDGVDTIIRMVVPYSRSILGADDLGTFTLLAILLLIQIIAFPFAILYGKLAKKFSVIRLIQSAIVVYLFTVIYAVQLNSMRDVYILGILVASVQGGIQALSRSYFAKIIPKHKSNEFFGFYNIFGKFAAILGPAIMALINTLTGNPRYTILGIIPLFVIGLVITFFLPNVSPEDEVVA